MKLRLKLSKEQINKLKKGKNITIGETEIRKSGDYQLSLCASKNLSRAVDKYKKIRISMGDIENFEEEEEEEEYEYEDEDEYEGGSSLHQRNMRRLRNTFSKKNWNDVKHFGNVIQNDIIDKTVPRTMQRKLKGKIMDKMDNYIDGMGYEGGSSLHQRNMRRLKNTFSKKNWNDVKHFGNVIQNDIIDKTVPRTMQRKLKGKILDKLDNYIEGMGMVPSSTKRMKYPLPSSAFEPNNPSNIQSIQLRGRRIHGSSFRGPS
jgi:ribosomal protein L9